VIEALKQQDAILFLRINGWHHPIADKLMWLLSNDFLIYPFVAVFLFWLFKKSGLKALGIVLLGIGFCVATADLSSNFVKHQVKRYRPSHNLMIKEQVHSVNEYKGGQYGFYSSHASNTFAITALLFLFLRNTNKRRVFYLFFLLPCLIGYSRVYLGVHYPSDVAIGALSGILIAIIVKAGLEKFFEAKP